MPSWHEGMRWARTSGLGTRDVSVCWITQRIAHGKEEHPSVQMCTYRSAYAMWYELPTLIKECIHAWVCNQRSHNGEAVQGSLALACCLQSMHIMLPGVALHRYPRAILHSPWSAWGHISSACSSNDQLATSCVPHYAKETSHARDFTVHPRCPICHQQPYPKLTDNLLLDSIT